MPLLHLETAVNAETVGAEVWERVGWGDPILALGSGPAAPGRRFGLFVHCVVCLSAVRQSRLQGRLGLLPEIAFWCLPGS